MRKIKGDKGWWRQELKGLPKGVCELCGGKGKYKETFKHKNPVIHTCWKCRGTGVVKIEVRYIGNTDIEKGLSKFSRYEVISENEFYYVILSRRKEMLQIDKEMFDSL